eukprot:COSAG01_NODE_35530_length_530_cov_1.668213_1_plen_30_part_10
MNLNSAASEMDSAKNRKHHEFCARKISESQ